jgi:hypothetical protein
MSSPVLFLGAVATVATVATARPADACSPPEPGVYSRDVLPAPGTTAVPTNVRIAVQYDRTQTDVPATLTLVTDDGAPVAADAESISERGAVTIFLRPRQALTARTRYRVLDQVRIGDDCPAAGRDACTGAAVAISAFTTGAGADTAAPTGGVGTVATRYSEPFDGSCSSLASVVHEAEVARVSDEQPASSLRYNVYDLAGRRVLTATDRIELGHSCPADDGGIDAFTVRVVDVAGNEGPAIDLAGRTCASFEDGGCSVGGGAGLLAALGGLGLLARRRR